MKWYPYEQFSREHHCLTWSAVGFHFRIGIGEGIEITCSTFDGTRVASEFVKVAAIPHHEAIRQLDRGDAGAIAAQAGVAHSSHRDLDPLLMLEHGGGDGVEAGLQGPERCHYLHPPAGGVSRERGC